MMVLLVALTALCMNAFTSRASSDVNAKVLVMTTFADVEYGASVSE